MVLILYIISLRYFNNKVFHHFIVLAYIAFYVIMIISTGGLSTSRYVFPVSLAIIVFQSVLILNAMGGTWNQLEGVDANSAKIRVAAIFAYFFVPAILMTIWFFYSTSVSTIRYKTINLSNPQIIADIDKITNLIGNKKESIVVASPYAMLLYKAGFSNIVIHDQPGVMLPWKIKNMGELSPMNRYANDLTDYLRKNEIRYIISGDKSCDVAIESLVDPPRSWSEILNFGYQLWNRFICSGLETRYTGSPGIYLYEISN